VDSLGVDGYVHNPNFGELSWYFLDIVLCGVVLLTEWYFHFTCIIFAMRCSVTTYNPPN
jgi:hypothetical protein